MYKEAEHQAVAHRHLAAAFGEVVRAQRCDDSEATVQFSKRALDHLNRASKLLRRERDHTRRGPDRRVLELAYAHTWLAWRRIHDVVFNWSWVACEALDEVHRDTRDALEALQRLSGPRSVSAWDDRALMEDAESDCEIPLGRLEPSELAIR